MKGFNPKLVEAQVSKKKVISGPKVPEISLKGTSWNLGNQCLVNLKSCKTVENARFPWQPMR